MKDIRCFVFNQVVKWYKHCFLVLFHYSIPLSWDTNNRCEKLQKEISDVYMRPLPPLSSHPPCIPAKNARDYSDFYGFGFGRLVLFTISTSRKSFWITCSIPHSGRRDRNHPITSTYPVPVGEIYM